MRAIIKGKLYDTREAQALATNEFSDGSNRLSHGRATRLFRTKKGSFFAAHETCWQGERDTIEPLSIEEAKEVFEDLEGDPDNYPEEFGEPEEA